ncbi:Protein of uncharacterised function (DUF2608) [Legionella lansingensis]|uniref:Uncharacterized protein n=1 Tax=Legionella lansingensis TaxID=45067 RepID=A0A0W0VXT7_9GAMM|nr:DUF2608 domain-containing protein [Legionella lansingensis]KTD24965.1 hypothetical protein Llan_0270 [Legionella lansingensis]SNV48178.1 Protein of uncharacterised function (DUF2608) [Legionella lansingensis]
MFHKILEIKHFREALKDVHFDTWLILDLDNTVMTPRFALGGDAWFEGLFVHYRQKNIEQTVAEPSLMSVYNTAQHFVRTSAVESAIVIIIKALQDIGVPVIGLTARGYSIRHQTLRQLADMGVDFSRNSIVPDNDFCEGGIIFCDGKNKDEKLSAFFKTLKRLPHHVAMLDDKNKHLERVMLFLKSLGISFSGFRYSYLDEKVKEFNMEIANIQLAYLWKWLSPTVRKDIMSLKLISEEPLDPSRSSEYADGFFHPDYPLHPVVSNTLGSLPQAQQPKLVRSISAASFFHEKNQTTANSSKRKRADCELPTHIDYEESLQVQPLSKPSRNNAIDSQGFFRIASNENNDLTFKKGQVGMFN